MFSYSCSSGKTFDATGLQQKMRTAAAPVLKAEAWNAGSVLWIFGARATSSLQRTLTLTPNFFAGCTLYSQDRRYTIVRVEIPGEEALNSNTLTCAAPGFADLLR